MRVFITCDLHHGIRREFSALTERAAAMATEAARPGDALVLGGDVACEDAHGLAACLALFEGFPGPRALVPGNHDLWSAPGRGRGARWLYEHELPRIAGEHGFAVLDKGPVTVPLPQGGLLGLAGSFGGHDFTLSDLAPLTEEEREEVLLGWRKGRFRSVYWNDYRMLWEPPWEPWDHAAFAGACAERLAEHLAALEADPAVRRIVCVTHTGAHLEEVKDHPMGEGRPLAGNLWFRGLSGSRRLGDAIARSPKTRLHVCGHTHHARAYVDETARRWINVGCDYDCKRWLIYDVLEDAVSYSNWVS